MPLSIFSSPGHDKLPPGTAVAALTAGGKPAFVYAPEAVATEETATDLSGEFQRRTRIAAGNFQALREIAPLLRPGFVAFAFVSHKLLRWLVPVFAVTAIVANIALLGSGWVYAVTFAAAIALGIASAVPTERMPRLAARFCHLARYFVEMNAALLVGLVRHLSGPQAATWRRTERVPARSAARAG